MDVEFIGQIPEAPHALARQRGPDIGVDEHATAERGDHAIEADLGPRLHRDHLGADALGGIADTGKGLGGAFAQHPAHVKHERGIGSHNAVILPPPPGSHPGGRSQRR